MMKIKKPALFNDYEPIYSNPGTYFEPEYQLAYRDNGEAYLKEIGVIQTYKIVQSHAASCDLSYILDTLDPNAVLGQQTDFITFSDAVLDLTALPKNPGEMFNLVKSAEYSFNRLPIEVRKAFNMSPINMMNNLDNVDIINSLINQNLVKVESEVKDNE